MKGVLWVRVQFFWNNKHPEMIAEWTARNLEAKWGSIKHDMSKFHGIYMNVKALKVSGTSEKDVIRDLLHMYQLKHPKRFDYEFKHYWHVLKEVPHWAKLHNDLVKTTKSFKKKRFEDALGGEEDSAMESKVAKLHRTASLRITNQTHHQLIGHWVLESLRMNWPTGGLERKWHMRKLKLCWRWHEQFEHRLKVCKTLPHNNFWVSTSMS